MKVSFVGSEGLWGAAPLLLTRFHGISQTQCQLHLGDPGVSEDRVLPEGTGLYLDTGTGVGWERGGCPRFWGHAAGLSAGSF